MNILIMDGIPHDHPYAPYSETMAKRIMKEDHHTIEFFQLSKMNLKYCTGCWSCWYKTPGLCPIKDDQSQLISRIHHADHLIYISPVILGYESALLKTCKDRSIPLIHPYITIHQGEQHHRKRYKAMPLINVLMLSDKTTSPEDLSLIEHTYQRVALNYQSRMNLFHSHKGKGGLDYVLNHL